MKAEQFTGHHYGNLKRFLENNGLVGKYGIENVMLKRIDLRNMSYGGSLCLVNSQENHLFCVLNHGDWLLIPDNKEDLIEVPCKYFGGGLLVMSDRQYRNFKTPKPTETDILNISTIIGSLVDCGGQYPVRIIEKIEVAIAAQPLSGYVTETRFIGVQKAGMLVTLQPHQLHRIVIE